VPNIIAPKTTKVVASGFNRTMRANVAGISISHPDRVLFPEAGSTKLDLAHYYETIADWILPHLVDRPLTLVRCPHAHGPGRSGAGTVST